MFRLLPYFLAACVPLLGCGVNNDSADPSSNAPDTAPPGATKICDQDSDGDNISDPVEIAVGSDPNSAEITPASLGLRVFVMPFQNAPSPIEHQVQEHARITKADVAILLDTTGSMANITGGIQSSLLQTVSLLAGQVDDLAFGAAGYGDFPSVGGNSEYDVPFYLVHRIMTANTSAGMQSLQDSFEDRNIVRDGLGPWFAQMRGGDEPEQGWEALRQLATGVGITYPGATSGTYSVPAFDPQTAYPTAPPVGENVGVGGGMGFRADSLPIVIMVTDTEHHDQPVVATSPVTASKSTALNAIRSIGAKVVGLRPYSWGTHESLDYIVNASGTSVPPSAWGSGSDRPVGCLENKCCVRAHDRSNPEADIQPDPVDGQCSLVFRDARWSSYAPNNTFAQQLALAVTTVVRGVRFAISAELLDDNIDTVDVVDAFVDRIEAVQSDACPYQVQDTNEDSIADTFPQVSAAAQVCFEVVAKTNNTIVNADVAQVFPASLQLFGDGLANRSAYEVLFVVPPSTCAQECILDIDCPGGEFCNSGSCRRPID